jgi:hypothetical protein
VKVKIRPARPEGDDRQKDELGCSRGHSTWIELNCYVSLGLLGVKRIRGRRLLTIEGAGERQT